jgi:hypothetical protein
VEATYVHPRPATVIYDRYKAVINVATGIEYRLFPFLPVRLGFFSNRDAVGASRALDIETYKPNQDAYGESISGTLGLSSRGRRPNQGLRPQKKVAINNDNRYQKDLSFDE